MQYESNGIYSVKEVFQMENREHYMKTIALCGRSDTGKTSTVKMFMKYLIDNGAKLKYCYYTNPIFQDIITYGSERWKTSHGNVRNITAILGYKGKTIVVTSVGDSTTQIKNSFDLALKKSGFKQLQIDVFVCACHPRMNLSGALGVNPNNIIYVEKQVCVESLCNKMLICNLQDKQHLIDELNKIIK